MRTPIIIVFIALLAGVALYGYGAVRGRTALVKPLAIRAPVTLATVPSVSPADRALTRSLNPKYTIIEYGDLTCEACRAAEPALRALLATRNDVKVVWRDFPIQGANPFSEKAAAFGLCAAREGRFWEFHDALLDRSDFITESVLSDVAASVGLDTERLAACKNDERIGRLITAALSEAAALGLRGAPEFFIDGVRYEGPHTADGFAAALKKNTSSTTR